MASKKLQQSKGAVTGVVASFSRAMPHSMPWHPRLSERLGLFRVFSAPWFVFLLTLLVVIAAVELWSVDRKFYLFSPRADMLFADDARWPIECSTWTAAAVVLAVDALSCTTPGSDIFRGTSLPGSFTEIGLECGCVPSDASEVASADRVAGLSPHAR